MLRLLLRDLILEPGPAEPGRQHLLQDPFEVRAGERHAFAGQLLEAPDLREMHPQAERPQQAITVALLDVGVIAELHVEGDLGGYRAERGEQRRVHDRTVR